MNRFDQEPVPTGNGHPFESQVNSLVRSRITPFERRILRLVAGGMRRREIAHQLHRSPQTISNSLTKAKDKLGARTLAEAAARVAKRDMERR